MKQRILFVGDSIAHNLMFRDVEEVTNTTLKTAKAYSSVKDENARFSHKNVTDVTIKELKNSAYDSLVLAAPTVDISNLDTSKPSTNDNTEDIKEKVIRSCKNIFEVAHKALAKYPKMKNVTIMEHGPRFDEVEVDPE
jgi:hypothetical protein